MKTRFNLYFIILSIVLLLDLQVAQAASKQQIDIKVDAALQTFNKEVTGAEQFLKKAKGVLIFPEVINDPVVGFVISNKGMMYNLTLEGSKISKLKK